MPTPGVSDTSPPSTAAPCGVIGTLGYGRPGALIPGLHTTPDALTLQRQLAAENRSLREQLRQVYAFDNIIGKSKPMRKVFELIKLAAPAKSNILVLGESGTGKELVAKAIHHHSRRVGGPFVTVNSGSMPPDLLESNLFGHVKGAFTGAVSNRTGRFELAAGGTLFLDEVGDMPMSTQVKLLRVIQEREVQRLGSTQAIPVDIRLIAATHRDLRDVVACGYFREYLYYRLDVVRLHLPPLAERRDDIPMLAYYFLRKHAARIGKDVEDIGPEAMAALVEYGYPGNIRELENIIERAVTLTRSKELTIRDLPPSLADHNLQVVREKEGRLPTLAEREEEYIRYVLDHCGQNRTRAAAILGIDRVSLWRKLKKYGMSEEEES